MADRYFGLNKQDVNAEVLDGEAIIINVTTGTYYSIEDAGAFVWGLLTSGFSLAQSVQAVMDRYQVSAEQANADLADFVSQLIAEDLISETEAYGSSSMIGVTVPDSAETYKRPSLNIYRDMGDLLALDPPTPGMTISSWELEPDPDASKTDE